jgi:hypothetical protein
VEAKPRISTSCQNSPLDRGCAIFIHLTPLYFSHYCHFHTFFLFSKGYTFNGSEEKNPEITLIWDRTQNHIHSNLLLSKRPPYLRFTPSHWYSFIIFIIIIIIYHLCAEYLLHKYRYETNRFLGYIATSWVQFVVHAMLFTMINVLYVTYYYYYYCYCYYYILLECGEKVRK